jgi:hypothetical protein
MPTTIADIIQKAAALPLRDAAYLIWREKIHFERLEGRSWPKKDMSTPEARFRSMQEITAQLKQEHDFAQDGPSFDRLKRAHPNAPDLELKRAIVTAVQFDDACFRHFERCGRNEWEAAKRAVARAANEHPGYLEETLFDARNWVAFNMK